MSDTQNKISLSDAHAALDAVAISHGIGMEAPVQTIVSGTQGAPVSLMDQVSAPRPPQTVVVEGPAPVITTATFTAPAAPQHVGVARVEPVLGGNAGQASEQSATTDLLTLVRVKLNRVASEFGIPYAVVRDFFTSHL
jgi:hypothetical protein